MEINTRGLLCRTARCLRWAASTLPLLAALWTGPVHTAVAATIDFDTVDNTVGDGFPLGEPPLNPYSEDGFTLVNSDARPIAIFAWSKDDPENADPDGATLTHNYGGTTTTLTRDGGGAFTFVSIDLTDGFDNKYPGGNAGIGGSVKFDLVFSDTSTLTTTVEIDGLSGFETFLFNAANLLSVAWTPLTTFGPSNGPLIQVDNIVVSAVPLPAALPLLVSALGFGMLFARRRRGTGAVALRVA